MTVCFTMTGHLRLTHYFSSPETANLYKPQGKDHLSLMTVHSRTYSRKKTPSISIMLICKYDLFFRMIENTLNEAGFMLSCICKCPEKAADYYNSVQPDLVLVDSGWNNSLFSAEKVMSALFSNNSNCKIILVSTFFDHGTRTKALELGAKGYLHTDARTFLLIEHCLRNVYEGKQHFMNDASSGAAW